ATASGPTGVAIDPAAGRIYWGNLTNNTISFARLDGTGGGQLNLAGATASQPVFPALLEAPAGAGAPQISGGASAGSTLSCSQGAWAPDLLGSFLYRAPRSFAYQWQLNGSDLAGATGSSYTAGAPGSHACRVTATNQAGSASQTSAARNVSVAPAAQGKDPKCPKLRKKLKRQGRKLSRAVLESKRAQIKANIEDTKKRLKKLGC
ncbi:MAG: hypothetical protein ACRDL6_08910, partial [Solirubrobacterales bacterium]